MSDMPPPPPPYATPTYSAPNTMFKNPAGVGKALWISFIVLAVVEALSMIAHFQRASFLSSIIDGDLSNLSSRADRADSFVDNMNSVDVFASIVIGIMLIVWLHRITRHSRSEGAIFSRSDGWAIGGFFVPIGNLFIPYKFAVENLTHYTKYGRLTISHLTQLNVWWFTFIAAYLLNMAATGQDPVGFESLRTQDLMSAAAGALFTISAFFGYRIVRAFTDAQPSTYG